MCCCCLMFVYHYLAPLFYGYSPQDSTVGVPPECLFMLGYIMEWAELIFIPVSKQHYFNTATPLECIHTKPHTHTLNRTCFNSLHCNHGQYSRGFDVTEALSCQMM